MGNILIMLQLIMKRLSGIQKEFQISNIKIYNWKTFEKNNATSAINILYIKQKEIGPAYISKIDSNCGKKIILMIPNKEKEGWHYLAVKMLTTLLREVT